MNENSGKKKNCFSKETPTEEKFEKNVWKCFHRFVVLLPKWYKGIMYMNICTEHFKDLG